MYSHNNIIPNNYQSMYRNNNNNVIYKDGERFFLAPFVVGGLAGTALGYGLANNNQLNNFNGGYYPQPFYPMPYNYPCCGNNYHNNFYR